MSICFRRISLIRKEDDNDHHNPPSGNGCGNSGKTEEFENKGALTIDATCAPVYIRYPQDVSLLNEAREKLEEMIFWFHKAYGVALPRRDCRAGRYTAHFYRIICICCEHRKDATTNTFCTFLSVGHFEL